MPSAAWVSRARRCSRRASRGSTAPDSATGAACDLVVGERSRDDEPLDLARTFEQRVDLGVAMPLLDREVPDVAVPAADLDRLLGDLDRDLAGLQLRHRALGLLELAAVPTFPERPPDERPRGLDLGRHVREHERDRLVFDQRPAELLALLRVLQRKLESRASDAERLRTDDGSRQLERAKRDRRARMRPCARAGQLRLELLHPAQHVLERDPAVLEKHLRRMRGADAHLPFLLALTYALGTGRNHEARLAARSELRLHRGDHDVHVRDAAVGDEDLLAVDHPVAIRAHGARLHRGDIRPGLRFGDGKGAKGGLLDGAEARWDPGRDLFRSPLREDGRDREAGALDGERDAGAAPGQLLGDQRRHDAGRVGEGLLQELDPVQPYLGRLLDHRPRELLGFVVLRGHRPDLFLSEAVNPIPDLTLLVAQLEGNHFSPVPRTRSRLRLSLQLFGTGTYRFDARRNATPRCVIVSMGLTGF